MTASPVALADSPATVGGVGSTRRASWHEARLQLVAHPLLWPLSRLVHRAGAVVRVPGVGVVVNDALIAHEVLTRDDAFRKQGPGGIAEIMTQAFGPSALANMDGDPHRALRKRLGPLASAEQAEQWLDASRAPLDRAVEQLGRGEVVDVARMARALSGRLTLTLMGVPPDANMADDADALAVHALGERIASALRISRLPARELGRVRADLAQLLAYADDAFASPTLPATSLVARLRAMGCNADETRGILSIFFVAGALTLGVALPRLLALLIDSGQLALVHADPALTMRAVDEGLRYTCPVPLTLRLAAASGVIGGVPVHAGERVVVLTSNLARDPQLFPNPGRFDITRRHDPRARYLWYGAGPHFCLGFTLAQRTLQDAVGLMAAQVPRLRVVRRRASRAVLLPAWQTLQLVRADG